MSSAAKRVCIVILTYKRNDALLRVVQQCREIIAQYRGQNSYELCVADSDRNNPLAPLPAELGVKYSVNPGYGFDDNILHFWQSNLDNYDFIFSMSDDDLFAPWLNPLYLLDAAMETGNQAVLFNHRYFKLQPNGGLEVGGVNFPELNLLFDKNLLLERVLKVLPSHIGILYSTKLLRVTLKQAAQFRNTLHLYAVPVIFAAAGNTLLFSEHVLCLYHDDAKADGAWTGGENVMNGLVQFLRKLKELVPADMYRVAEEGYFNFYFGRGSWLRQKLGANPRVKSEEQIRELLAAA